MSRRAVTALVAAGAGLAACYWAVGEISHAWAHRRGLGRPPSVTGRREAIILLGYPSNPDGSPHPLQRWRAAIAARSISPRAASSVVVCSGVDHAGRSEAVVLAELLRELGVRDDQIVLEERARTTWQNLEFSAPLVADADVIKVASNSLHAYRGRRFLRRQRPDLAARLAAADDYRFGEYSWLKARLAVYEAVGQWREWRRPRLPDVTPTAAAPPSTRPDRPPL